MVMQQIYDRFKGRISAFNKKPQLESLLSAIKELDAQIAEIRNNGTESTTQLTDLRSQMVREYNKLCEQQGASKLKISPTTTEINEDTLSERMKVGMLTHLRYRFKGHQLSEGEAKIMRESMPHDLALNTMIADMNRLQHRYLNINGISVCLEKNEDPSTDLWQKYAIAYFNKSQREGKGMELISEIAGIDPLTPEEEAVIKGKTINDVLGHIEQIPPLLLIKMGRNIARHELGTFPESFIKEYSQGMSMPGIVSAIKTEFGIGSNIFLMNIDVMREASDTRWVFKKDDETGMVSVENRLKVCIKLMSSDGGYLNLDPIEFYVTEQLSYDSKNTDQLTSNGVVVQRTEVEGSDKIRAAVQDLMAANKTFIGLVSELDKPENAGNKDKIKQLNSEIAVVEGNLRIKMLTLSTDLLFDKMDKNQNANDKKRFEQQGKVLLSELQKTKQNIARNPKLTTEERQTLNAKVDQQIAKINKKFGFATPTNETRRASAACEVEEPAVAAAFLQNGMP